MLVIGSRALLYHGLTDRIPADTDVVCRYEEYESYIRANRHRFDLIVPTDKGKKFLCRGGVGTIEFEIAWPGSTAEGLILHANRAQLEAIRFRDIDLFTWIANVDMLYTIKSSHKYLRNSPHFAKTMRDWRALRGAGAKVFDHEWLKTREKETYTYAHPKLDVSKSEFFSGDGIEYVYDHDTIHMSVATCERPAYTYFKRPGSDVMCDRSLFGAAPMEVRLASVVEESYVLALERSQIPFGYKWAPKRSFDVALEKVCTSITSGWWREFAYEHYHDAQGLYRDDYVDRFRAGVASGLVKRIADGA